MSAIPKNEVGSTVADANADVELGNISTYSLTSTLCRPPTNFTSASTLKDSEIPQPADPARRPRLQRLFVKIGQWMKKKYLKNPSKVIILSVFFMVFLGMMSLSVGWMVNSPRLPELPEKDRDYRVLPPTLA
ncbi:hypothetical protein MBM_00189 [Drepanopeziza brunnea f. sp. 'multigermtubi' MB_m1]|uniref:Uncharacterized protein n=1 Tax=Marssonina brunnea f. sp. multigermtubi (strain MB_m1) TaxID=1072389 RepID=K1X7N1_MARBU|nr:uncharacterized protein MBM_00189 [Drepanopeziza brunnea f. sp. 'multigermtubi' MB_m1]EKD21076.1 hypothetical protein MBM_00189 [Drepanopeziza brunnea f. sp. 'multigermtubi' MB_m1]